MVSGWEAGIGEPGFYFGFRLLNFGIRLSGIRVGTLLVAHGPRIADLILMVKVVRHKLKIKSSVENSWRYIVCRQLFGVWDGFGESGRVSVFTTGETDIHRRL